MESDNLMETPCALFCSHWHCGGARAMCSPFPAPVQPHPAAFERLASRCRGARIRGDARAFNTHEKHPPLSQRGLEWRPPGIGKQQQHHHHRYQQQREASLTSSRPVAPPT